MKLQQRKYRLVSYPKYRRWMVAAIRSTQYKPMIHGLFEVDVTSVRASLRDHKAKAGESLSFTAFLIACLAKAVDEHRAVQAIRLGGKRLVIFEDVDVLTDIERDVAGQSFVVPSIVRAANRKTVREVHDELRAAQRADTHDVLKRFRPLSLPAALFGPFLWAFHWFARRRPQLWKTITGTVEVSAIGMFGRGAGWGIPPAPATALMVTVGGIGERLTVVDGHPVLREYLSLTVSADHDIVDGAPLARFTGRLKELIEGGYGLDRSTQPPDQNTTREDSVKQAHASRPSFQEEQDAKTSASLSHWQPVEVHEEPYTSKEVSQ